MALESSLHLSASTNGAGIEVAQGGGNVLVHTTPEFTDRVRLHINNPVGGSGCTMSILINAVEVVSITLPGGGVYDYGSVAVTGLTVHVKAVGGDTTLQVTGEIVRGGLANRHP